MNMKTKTTIDRIALDIAHGLLDAARDSAYLSDTYTVGRDLHSKAAFYITDDNGETYQVSVERTPGGAAEAAA